MAERRTVLAIDVGGSHVKLLASGEDEPRRFESGKSLVPQQLVDGVRAAADRWTWDVVTVGVPTPVYGGKVIAEPVNLGEGWVGFDFESAFEKPVKVVNDAVMQAIGSYDGGRMLFLGLGTGLGSALIVDGVVEPLELGHLPYRESSFEDYVSERALEQHGKARWTSDVFDVVEHFANVIEPQYVVVGGGAVEQLERLPPGTRRGDNDNAFNGGFRLWEDEWRPRAG